MSLLIDDTANTSTPLSWQTSLADLMREDFVLSDDYTSLHATLEDALSHRTGMPRHELSYGSLNFTVQDVVKNLRHLPLTAEIRTKWQYCNMMYITVSHFIETFTGSWLGDFLRMRIYEPLGMKNTFFSLGDAQKAESAGGLHLATPYYWANYTHIYHSMPWLDGPANSGDGATISNVLDYAKWLRCHMSKSAPMSRAGHEALHSPRMIISPLTQENTGFRGFEAYALGWEVSNYRGETILWHTGGIPGFTTIMLFFPRLQWGLTMMANGGNGEAIQVLLFILLDDMFDVPQSERYHWTLLLDVRNLVRVQNLKYAREILFPDAPKKKRNIPHSLPLDFYTGVRLPLQSPSLARTNTP